ncbi:MAG: hypothetical protein AB7Q37_11050 [Pyrinomonadaceae bacterium]
MKEARVKHTRFNLFIWRKLPACKEMVKIITASMDEKLSWREWILLKIHLLSCDPCVNFIKQLRFISTALRNNDDRIGQEDESVKLSDKARSRMKEALDNPS